ncbi:hypothetical protein ONE63_010631 [Megalurothrips usitatus]|uniref:Peptidase S1 domain-containing protein n=1 Tax=Megalurothrips usitatus TaxID=439358 RepID=A0AAV7XI43_9NEOP|nr:hypothetical protein ONE63_010631 [Megalurothrips usitatus]
MLGDVRSEPAQRHRQRARVLRRRARARRHSQHHLPRRRPGDGPGVGGGQRRRLQHRPGRRGGRQAPGGAAGRRACGGRLVAVLGRRQHPERGLRAQPDGSRHTVPGAARGRVRPSGRPAPPHAPPADGRPRPSDPPPPASPPAHFRRSAGCGIAGGAAANPLVTRGAAAVRGRWPWLVALFKKLGRRDQVGLNFECGASLLSRRHVVTAAHCVEVRGRRGRPVDAASLVVYLGKHDLLSYTEPGQQTAEVDAVRLHPEYGRAPSTASFDNDIALLVLSDAVEVNKYTRPVCLWDAGLGGTGVDAVVGRVGAVPGWGKDDTGAISNELRVANMPIVSQETCLRSNVFYHAFTSNTTFCAGFRNGTSVCNGDSGGGLFLQDGDGRWRIRGIVSVSMFNVNDQSCDSYNYAVFTDVAQYLPWLREEMRAAR